MVAAGATTLTEAFKATGLHNAMYVIPLMAVLASVVLFAAASTVTKDMSRQAAPALRCRAARELGLARKSRSQRTIRRIARSCSNGSAINSGTAQHAQAMSVSMSSATGSSGTLIQ